MQASRAVLIAGLFLTFAAPALADESRYRTPPAAIEAALRAPAMPFTIVSPRRDFLALETPLRYPPVADLARPMLRLAGLRIDPSTNGIHHASGKPAAAFERGADR